MSSSPHKFFVPSANRDFSNRQQDVFASLNALESQHQKFQEDNVHAISSLSRAVEVDEEEREKEEEEEFKAPLQLPHHRRPAPPKVRSSPDYMRNPEKWTKYSLADVDSSQMSDKANTAAAMAFLQERRSTAGETGAADEPIRFVAVAERRRLEEADATNKPVSGKSDKWVMPEYVVGQKDAKRATKRVLVDDDKAESGGSVSLTHLNEDSDDEANERSETDKTAAKPSFKIARKAKRSLRKRDDDDE